MLDLKKTQCAKANREIHKLFCSNYVQLSRVISLQGVQLLDKIDWHNVNHKPHLALQLETAKLDQYSNKYLTAWSARQNNRRQICNMQQL